jgi:hypothetical protein
MRWSSISPSGFNVTVKLNLVKGNTPASITPLPPWVKRERGENHLLPDQKAGAGTLRRRAINSSPIIADSFFICRISPSSILTPMKRPPISTSN